MKLTVFGRKVFMKNDLYLWLDIETTGLLPAKGHILEVACIATNDQLEELGRFESKIKMPTLVRLFPDLYMDKTVLQMHKENNLYMECMQGPSLKTVYKSFEDFIKKFPFKYKYFVGNSIGSLDLPYLRHHMPRILKQVHYRSIDISGYELILKMNHLERTNVIQERSQKIYNKKRGRMDNHRALQDTLACIDQYKFLKDISRLYP
jgi:oligoribonuclease